MCSESHLFLSPILGKKYREHTDFILSCCFVRYAAGKLLSSPACSLCRVLAFYEGGLLPNNQLYLEVYKPDWTPGFSSVGWHS